MNATGIIVIAVAAVFVLGMIAFLTLARRSDVRGAGALSAETRQRDRAARAARPVEAPSRNAAEAEAEGSSPARPCGSFSWPAAQVARAPA